MGSQTPLQLPRIDFSLACLQHGNESWSSVRAQVHDALETYGCFEAVYPRVPVQVRRAIFPAMEELFGLPTETKMLHTSPKPYHGYIRHHVRETMSVDDADIAESVEMFTENLWPDGNPTFSETILSFSKTVATLDQLVRRLILESLGLEKYYGSHLDSTNYLLRIMKYDGPRTEDPEIGLGEHTDKSVVTVLYQSFDALEVQTKDGGWIPVAVSPDSFIVLAGDTFMAWTNDRVHSPLHRVVMAGNEVRYSLGLFSVPKAGHLIQTPAELVDEEHPLLFKPFDHAEFLKFYYTAEGQRAKSALAAYCGASN